MVECGEDFLFHLVSVTERRKRDNVPRGREREKKKKKRRKVGGFNGLK